MFVEPDGFVVVTVEQAFAVQPCLVNQSRQVDVTAEFLVRTAWMQPSHEADRCYVAGNGRATASWKLDSVGREAVGFGSPSNSPCANPICPMASWPENIPPFSTLIALAVTSPSSEPFLWTVTDCAMISPDILPLISMCSARTVRKQ